MPWRLEHRCAIERPSSDFGIFKIQMDGRPMTKVQCPQGDCREVFFIEGHEMFANAMESDGSSSSLYPGLPPGFVVPSRRAG